MYLDLKKIYLFILTLSTIHFWGYLGIPVIFFRLIDLGMIGYSIFCFYYTHDRDGLNFKIPIIIYVIGTILNMVSSYFNHGQMFKDSFIQFFPHYFILFYFILHYLKFERKDLETLIITFALIYVVIYLFQESRFPERFFSGPMYRDRGTIRLRIQGGGFIMLTYFLALNRYLLARRPIYLILCGLMFYITLKSGFRSLTLISIILSVILYIKLVNRSGYNYLLVVFAAIVLIVMLQWNPTAKIIDGMINVTEEQRAEQSRGEKNIRILQLEYFSKEYPENFSYYIFGGGLPGAFGDYSNQMDKMAKNGYFWVDLGLIGYYYVMGLIMLVGLLSYALLATFIKLPVHLNYLNFYFAYLILASILTAELYRGGIYGVEAIALYLIDITRKE